MKRARRNRKKNPPKRDRLINEFIRGVFGPSTKTKKRERKQKGLGSKLRVAMWVVAVLGFFAWSGTHALHSSTPTAAEPPKIYATQCQDDLKSTFVRAIEEANSSIVLIIYSLTEPKVIQALKERAEAGVEVTVIHDPTTVQQGFQRLGHRVHRIEKAKSGLMHQKILVVDGERIWIGSANLTPDSLRFDDNLVIGLCSTELARAITHKTTRHDFDVAGQHVEFWSLPEDKEKGLKRLLSLINEAEKSIRVAMFTWTHPALTDAIIAAHKRGVMVEVALDHGQGVGVSEASAKKLLEAGVPVRMSRGSELLHHKCAYIDGKILINGSANWTRAAFSKNDDCFLIIHDLTVDQTRKVEMLWHVIRCTSDLEGAHKLHTSRFLRDFSTGFWDASQDILGKVGQEVSQKPVGKEPKSGNVGFESTLLANKQHLSIFWQRPVGICHEEFEPVDMAA